MSTMRAIIVEHSGPPEVFQIKQIQRPEPETGWVLVRVKAFGLNRSEMFTRQGHSPDVEFPRILGIEVAGEVENDPSGKFYQGQKVVCVMGGMGRQFDGGYAEYVVLPVERLIPIQTKLTWDIIGAVPETFLTAWSSLTESLEIQSGQTLLVRGGTSSVGMSTISIAKNEGLTILATTRNETKQQALLDVGTDYVLIDDGNIAKKVRAIFPDGVDRVQELVGTKTLLDSLRATKPRGIVCVTGILGNEWAIANFEPIPQIPSSVRLTSYASESLNIATAGTALQNYIWRIEKGEYTVPIDRVFAFDEIVAAHHYMESNQATGKLVVVLD